ncbi:MAG: RnfABCDGE type electron transport complex subunit D, partial [Pseudomonadota bacterium]
MKFSRAPAPHVKPPRTVGQVMRHVLYALVPATAAHAWFFGFGIVLNMLTAVVFALALEALVLRWRGRPVTTALGDYSAVVTAVLLAFALPPLTPWWVTAIGITFAIVFAKHLYGGLGHNPFNPAMAGYVVLLVAFPGYMAQWPAAAMPEAGVAAPALGTTLSVFLTGEVPQLLNVDGVSGATPLDRLQTGLSQMMTMGEMHADATMSGLGGHGWTLINLAVALG